MATKDVQARGWAVISPPLGFLEGPVVMRDGSVVAVSIDRGRLYRIGNGEAVEIADTGGGPNGAVEHHEGALFVSQNGGAPPALNVKRARPGVQRVGPDGAVQDLAGGPQAPNDLAFGPDGYLYVTDPTRRPARDDGRIWRYDVRSGEAELVVAVGWYPNGIAFADESDCLYVADTGGRRIVRIPLAGATPDRVETVFEMRTGLPDGFAFDSEGNFVIAAVGREEADPGDVQVWSKDGTLLETLQPGSSRYYTNLALSPDRQLYLCDSTEGVMLRTAWPTAAMPLHPFRPAAAPAPTRDRRP